MTEAEIRQALKTAARTAFGMNRMRDLAAKLKRKETWCRGSGRIVEADRAKRRREAIEATVGEAFI